MKKVMFLLVGLLFSVSASAATLSLSGAGSSGATQDVSVFNNNGNLATGGGGTSGGAVWYSDFDLTTDVDTNAVVQWTFNPEANLQSATVGIGSDSNAGYFQTWNITSNFITSFLFLAGETYWIDIFNVTSSGLEYDVSVNAVPVPAALLLFAPALLGFFGLRRKAAVAA
jgi:hypothetical protein